MIREILKVLSKPGIYFGKVQGKSRNKYSLRFDLQGIYLYHTFTLDVPSGKEEGGGVNSLPPFKHKVPFYLIQLEKFFTLKGVSAKNDIGLRRIIIAFDRY